MHVNDWQRALLSYDRLTWGLDLAELHKHNLDKPRFLLRQRQRCRQPGGLRAIHFSVLASGLTRRPCTRGVGTLEPAVRGLRRRRRGYGVRGQNGGQHVAPSAVGDGRRACGCDRGVRSLPFATAKHTACSTGVLQGVLFWLRTPVFCLCRAPTCPATRVGETVVKMLMGPNRRCHTLWSLSLPPTIELEIRSAGTLAFFRFCSQLIYKLTFSFF